MTMQTFEISPEYRTNDVVVHDVGSVYWTPERIALSGQYQLAVYEMTRRLADHLGASSIADIGCGTGMKLASLFAERAIFGVDSPDAVSVARRMVPRGTFVGVDLESPLDLAALLPGCTRELVICADVIEHLARPDHLLASIHSFCTTETRFVLSSPDRMRLAGPRARRPSVPDHVREWSADELRRFVTRCGFDVLDQYELLPFPLTANRMTLRYLANRLRYRLPLRSNQALVCRIRR